MIRVLNIIDTGGPGGAETVFLHTATRLDPAEFLVTSIVSRDGWLAMQLREAHVEPHIVSAQGSFNISYLVRLARLANASKVQVILAHLYGSAIYASLLGRLLGLPVVVVLHGQTDISRSSRLGSVKSWIVSRLASRVVFVSNHLRHDLANVLSVVDAKAVVIPNGVDTTAFARRPERSIRQEIGLEGDILLVGAVGNIRRPKDYPSLLRAAAHLLGSGTLCHFVIAGEGSGPLFEELKELCTSLGLQRHVTFLGLRSDVARVLNNLDIFVLSSSTEGFSIACIEAMACGVPVVSTRSGGPEEILDAGRTGLLVPVGDHVALAGAIQSLADNPDYAARIAAAGKAEAIARFSLNAMLRSYESVLTSLVGSRA